MGVIGWRQLSDCIFAWHCKAPGLTLSPGAWGRGKLELCFCSHPTALCERLQKRTTFLSPKPTKVNINLLLQTTRLGCGYLRCSNRQLKCLFFFCLVGFVFWDRISLCISSWHWTLNPPTSAFHGLELLVRTPLPAKGKCYKNTSVFWSRKATLSTSAWL